MKKGEKLYAHALPYINSLKINLKFEIRKKLFKTIDDISGYQ